MFSPSHSYYQWDFFSLSLVLSPPLSLFRFLPLWLLAIYYGNSSHYQRVFPFTVRETNAQVEHLWSLDFDFQRTKMTTTIKSSFLIDDLLSAFKRPSVTTNSSHPSAPSSKEAGLIPSTDLSSAALSLNFFQPPNQFNQYAAIKPELHPFFFHGMFTSEINEVSSDRYILEIGNRRVAVIFSPSVSLEFLLHVY